MALQEGETYHCPDPACACEIEVTRGPANATQAGNSNPRCCCGREMQRGPATQAA